MLFYRKRLLISNVSLVMIISQLIWYIIIDYKAYQLWNNQFVVTITILRAVNMIVSITLDLRK